MGRPGPPHPPHFVRPCVCVMHTHMPVALSPSPLSPLLDHPLIHIKAYRHVCQLRCLNHVTVRKTPQKRQMDTNYHLCGTTTVSSDYSISSPSDHKATGKVCLGKPGVTDSVSVPTTLKPVVGDLSVTQTHEQGSIITKHSHRRGGTLKAGGTVQKWQGLLACIAN